MKKNSSFENIESITTDPYLKVGSKFPARKMALAKLTFDKMALFKKNNRIQQPRLTSLQKRLLFHYVQEPTEKQLKQFNVFQFYLFNADHYNLTPKQDSEEYTSQPKKKLKVKRDQLSFFQNELLKIYDQEPTEEQMLKLEDFLHKLFNNLLNKFDTQPKVEMSA